MIPKCSTPREFRGPMCLLDVGRPRTSMTATKAAYQNSGAYNRRLDNGSFQT